MGFQASAPSLRILALMVLLSGLAASSAAADETGLPVSSDDASVEVQGRQFDVFSVDADTARQRTEEVQKRLGPDKMVLSDCRVVRAVEHGVSNAATFFLGMCQEGSAGNQAQTDYCFKAGGQDFTIQRSYPDPETASELLQGFDDCLLETCANDRACD